MKINSRFYSFLGFIIAVFTIVLAIGLEFFYNLQPCILCVLQRIVFALLAIIFLIAALHYPRGYGTKIYGIFILLITTVGLFLSGRQVWLQIQHHSADGSICMPGFGYLISNFSLVDALKIMMQAHDNCAHVDWSFLGMSMAMWSLLIFIGLAIIALFMMRNKNSI